MAADLLATWRSGCALSDAWFHLAPSERWRKWEFPEATRRAALESLVWRDDWLSADEDERQGMLNATARLIEVRSPTTAREAEFEMKTWLLQAVRDGQLAGIGRLSDGAGELHVVPGVLFDQRYVRWESSAVADGVRSFGDVMVVPAESLAAEAQPAPRRKPGRGSKIDQVLQAIRALQIAGINLNAMKRRDAYKAVRNYARDNLDADMENGFSDPVIQRALVRSVGTRFP